LYSGERGEGERSRAERGRLEKNPNFNKKPTSHLGTVVRDRGGVTAGEGAQRDLRGRD